jgi:hypothetical protein
MSFWICDDEPLTTQTVVKGEPAPISIMAMTLPTPLTLPSVVRVARLGFLASARRAVRGLRQILMGALL